jgi:Divergent InlB B-repeat domain
MTFLVYIVRKALRATTVLMVFFLLAWSPRGYCGALLTLAWDASWGAATYRLYCRKSDGAMHLIRYDIATTQETLWLDGTEFQFLKVTAVSQDGIESAMSDGLAVRLNNGVWEAVPFNLTVEWGSGSGVYDAGTIVPVKAYESPGQAFDQWTGDIAVLSNPFLASTTAMAVSIPVEVIATFKPVTP